MITNLNGLYRYRMDDIIEYVKHEGPDGDAPLFLLCYRRGALLNHFGEKVTEQQMLRVIFEALPGGQRMLVDYGVTSNDQYETFNHTLFVELAPDVNR